MASEAIGPVERSKAGFKGRFIPLPDMLAIIKPALAQFGAWPTIIGKASQHAGQQDKIFGVIWKGELHELSLFTHPLAQPGSEFDGKWKVNSMFTENGKSTTFDVRYMISLLFAFEMNMPDHDDPGTRGAGKAAPKASLKKDVQFGSGSRWTTA